MVPSSIWPAATVPRPGMAKTSTMVMRKVGSVDIRQPLHPLMYAWPVYGRLHRQEFSHGRGIRVVDAQAPRGCGRSVAAHLQEELRRRVDHDWRSARRRVVLGMDRRPPQ